MCKVVFLNITIKLYDTLICHAYLSKLLIILHYKSTLIVYELCGSVVIYIQSHTGGCAVGCCVHWGHVLHIEYRTADKSPNLIIGLSRCALKMENLNVQNIKQSAQIFCFASDILNLRNGLTERIACINFQ